MCCILLLEVNKGHFEVAKQTTLLNQCFGGLLTCLIFDMA